VVVDERGKGVVVATEVVVTIVVVTNHDYLIAIPLSLPLSLWPLLSFHPLIP